MTSLVKVMEARAVGAWRLRVLFSDGQEGVRYFRELVFQEGSMVEPLRDVAVFSRVFVELGVPTWPNGFAVDAIELHREMKVLGLLRQAAA